MFGHFTQISDHLFVHHGCVNVGIIRSGNLAMLIDCGDESVRTTLNKLEITKIVAVLFTHHHRDNVAGIADIAEDVLQHCQQLIINDNGEYDVVADTQPGTGKLSSIASRVLKVLYGARPCRYDVLRPVCNLLSLPCHQLVRAAWQTITQTDVRY